MKIAICGVVFIRHPEAYKRAIESLDSFRSKDQLDVYLFDTECPDHFRRDLQNRCDGYFYNDRNILARSWNKAIDFSFKMGYDYCIVPNLDVKLDKDCIDNLVKFAEDDRNSLVYSGWCTNHPFVKRPADTYVINPVGNEHYNTYAFFMVRKQFLKMRGFDENCVPCYAEDVDMIYRLRLSNEKSICYRGSEFEHHLATTIKLGAKDIYEQSENNAVKYFTKKWGGKPTEQVFKTPFNKGGDINYWYGQ